ncbi:MAG: heparinase II/III family protein [Victivallaceae bacterium]|nr:heparinase II/III family protein [Victivallaceae bacterium]
MNFTLQKIALYAATIRHLKPEQIFYRIFYRLRGGCPRPGIAPAPPRAGAAALKTPFPRYAETLRDDATFVFLNAAHEVRCAADWNRAERGKLWLYNLHYFDFLRQNNLPAAVGEAWIERWIAENPPPVGNGWEPYPLSLRIVNWIKYDWSGHPLTETARHSLAVQLRALMSQLERHLLGNHLLANAKALVFAGLFFTGKEAEKWLKKGLSIYRKELPEQILADGGHFERSVMYHSIILEDMLDLFNAGAPLELRETIGKMLRFLAAMTSPDGTISFFNDGADKIALPTETIFEYAGELGFGRPEIPDALDLPQSGYSRFHNGNWLLICDSGPVGPDYQPGHAHADTLTFDLWYGKTHLVIDSATGEYVDTPLRREQRGTAGHNTVKIDGRNSSDVWCAHRVGRRAKITERRFSAGGISAAHDGYRPVIHRRIWHPAENGISICDSFAGKGRHELEFFWHFAPGSRIEIDETRAKISLGETIFALSLPGNAEIRLESGRFSPEFGRTLPHPVLHFILNAALPFELDTTIGLDTEK